VAARIVDHPAEAGERSERVLAQLDHLSRVAHVEQALDRVDHLVDSATPFVRVVVGDEAARVDRELDRAAKACQIHPTGVGGEPQAQALEDVLVHPGLLEQERLERLPVQALEPSANRVERQRLPPGLRSIGSGLEQGMSRSHTVLAEGTLAAIRTGARMLEHVLTSPQLDPVALRPLNRREQRLTLQR
jgi:hypothetical protein